MTIMRMRQIRHDGDSTIIDLTGDGGGGDSVSWNDITDKPATFPPTIGTSATTAMAGNKTPTTSQRGGVLQQAAIADLAADADAATIVTTVNSLLAAMRAAGVIAS